MSEKNSDALVEVRKAMESLLKDADPIDLIREKISSLNAEEIDLIKSLTGVDMAEKKQEGAKEEEA